MLDVRLRIPELMKSRKVRSAYELARLADFAISIPTAYRLVDESGKMDRVDMATLDALCKAFGVSPAQLLTQDEVPADWTPPRVNRKKKRAA